MMRHARIALAAMAAAALPSLASAQQPGPALNDTQALGRRLFVQSCGVCHTSVQRGAPRYGPALSQESLGGQEDVMREVISNGTPRMPGFKHHFERGEIDAVLAYLKTVPAPPEPGSRAQQR
jgi:mono/diheme cytochrome c family protein